MGSLRPEPWRKKLDGGKKGDNNLGILTSIVIGIILGIITYNFKSSHTLQSIFSGGPTNKHHSTYQINLVEQKRAPTKTGIREITKDTSLGQSRQRIKMKFGYASKLERGIKFAAEPTTRIAEVQYRNEPIPTVRVNSNFICIVNEQTGYKRMYIPPPL